MSGPALCFIDTETTGLDPERHEVWEVACILRRQQTPHDAVHDTVASGPGESVQADLDEARGRMVGTHDEEFVWQLPVDLSRADLIALNIGHFHERRIVGIDTNDHRLVHELKSVEFANVREKRWSMAGFAARFSRLTWGCHMVGMVPSFDTERLGTLLRRHGAVPGWHYQPIDVETLAAGSLLGSCSILTGAEHLAWLEHIDADRGAKTVGHFSERLALPWDSEELSRSFGIPAPEGADRHSALGDARWARDLWDAIHDGVFS